MKKIVFTALSLGIIGSFTSAWALFSDVPLTHNNYSAIEYLKETSVLKGYEDGSFGADRPINRAEALKVILVAAETSLSESESQNFPDVPADAWFAQYVGHAVGAGIVSGDGATGNFVPARQVNRAEYIKMILGSFEIDPTAYTIETTLNDVPEDAWFAPYINFAANFGILPTPDGNGNPSTPVTRKEAAQLLFNTLEKGKGLKAQTLLDTIENHLIKSVNAIEENDILDAALHIGKAEYLDTILMTMIPENTTVQTAHTTVIAMKNLVGAYAAGENGDTDSVITASKNAWAAADGIPKENGQQSVMAIEIKQLAEGMAAKAREAKEEE